MYDELESVIASFRHLQELGLDYTHRRLQLPVPFSRRQWMAYGYTVPSEAAAIATNDGVRVDIHGAGIEIVHPEFTIDYDYGPSGECDCFDAWRLALHRHRCRGLPMPVEGQLEIRGWLDAAAEDRVVIALPDSPCFMHPGYRSTWKQTAENG